MKLRLNRRKFLATASGLLVPAYLRAGPGLPFYASLNRQPLAGGNGLLTSLNSYWKMDEAANATAVDSIGSNSLTDVNGTIGTSVGGIINGSRGNFGVVSTGSALTHVTNSTFQLGAGVSSSFTRLTLPFASRLIESMNVKIEPVPPLPLSKKSFHSAGILHASQ